MKNYLKKILVMMLIIPTIFMFGCGSTPPPSAPVTPPSEQGGGNGGGNSGGGESNPPAVDPVEQAKITAYSYIKSLAQNDIYAGFSGVELDITLGSVWGGQYDISETNLTKNEWEQYAPYAGFQPDVYQLPAETPVYAMGINPNRIVGISPMGEGYYYSKVGETVPELTATLEQGVVTHSDKLVNVGNYIATRYVADEYVPYTYAYDFSEYSIASIFNIIGSTDSYSNLAANVENTIKDVVSYYDTSTMTAVDIDIAVEIKTLDTNKYALEIKAMYDTVYISLGSKVVSYTNYTFIYSSSALMSIEVQDGGYEHTFTWDSRDLKDYLSGSGLNVSAAFPSGCHVYMRLDNYKRLNIQFKAYDETKLPDLANYDLSNIQNIKPQIVIYYVGDDNTVTPSGPFYMEVGDLVTSKITWDMGTYKMYWDRELTNEIPLDTVIPGYQWHSSNVYVVKNQ